MLPFGYLLGNILLNVSSQDFDSWDKTEVIMASVQIALGQRVK